MSGTHTLPPPKQEFFQPPCSVCKNKRKHTDPVEALRCAVYRLHKNVMSVLTQLERHLEVSGITDVPTNESTCVTKADINPKTVKRIILAAEMIFVNPNDGVFERMIKIKTAYPLRPGSKLPITCDEIYVSETQMCDAVRNIMRHLIPKCLGIVTALMKKIEESAAAVNNLMNEMLIVLNDVTNTCPLTGCHFSTTRWEDDIPEEKRKIWT